MAFIDYELLPVGLDEALGKLLTDFESNREKFSGVIC